MKPFRGKRRGPQSSRVGFNLPVVGRLWHRHVSWQSFQCRFPSAAGALPACEAPRPVRRRSEAFGEGGPRFGGGVIDPDCVGPSADRGRLNCAVGFVPRLCAIDRLGGTVASVLRPRSFSGRASRSRTWRQWRIGRSPVRPVLKHGPRSLTCARVNGHVRNPEA